VKSKRKRKKKQQKAIAIITWKIEAIAIIAILTRAILTRKIEAIAAIATAIIAGGVANPNPKNKGDNPKNKGDNPKNKGDNPKNKGDKVIKGINTRLRDAGNPILFFCK
jgi:hypothetical protein